MVRTSAGCALFLLVGCGAPQRPAVMASPPPAAEFLVATLDSTFWVRSGPAGIRFRGAPLTVATFGGRFYEIFLADDDRSFDEALLVGQRIYRRDLMDGDSSLVFEDSVIPRIAREYARAHPTARPLEPDEEGAEDPETQATAELEIIGLHGPYLSYEYHVDVAVPGGEPWHTTRRGVLDLRSGRTMRVRDIFADSVATRLARQGRQAFRTAIDSLRIASGPDAEVSRRASLALGQLSFDDRSFVLTVVDSQLAVEFDIPERGPAVSDDVLPLTPVPASGSRWWSEVRNRFPLSEDDLDRWRRVTEAGYDVVARYDSTGERARLTITDSSLQEWQIMNVAAPVLHTFWLDHPAIDSVQRRALGRAFDAASLYDETTRTVRGPPRWHAPSRSISFAFFPPSAHRHALASTEDRQGEPTRVLRAHDAWGREQPRAHLRRRHSLHDGQDRGDRRVPAFARQRRHGVDRPGRFS